MQECRITTLSQGARMQVHNSSGCRNAELQLFFRVQECRFTTPQDAGIQVYNSFLG
jgi:hypothetical protein